MNFHSVFVSFLIEKEEQDMLFFETFDRFRIDDSVYFAHQQIIIILDYKYSIDVIQKAVIILKIE